MMKQEKQKLQEWLLQKIREEYPEDISLVVVHDHLVLPGDDFKKAFDYYVPATPRGNELARTMIIHEIGLDLYPRSWERLEGMARMEDFNTCVLADARIIYSRTPEEAARFTALQAKLCANLQDPAFMYQKALENLDTAMELFKTMIFKEDMSSLRLAAGYIQNYLGMALACLNHTYLKNSQEDLLEELREMPLLPEGLLPAMQRVICTEEGAALKQLCYQLIRMVRHLIEQHPAPAEAGKASSLLGLADWYRELSYTWRRIRYYAERGDAQRCYQWGCMLQEELNVVSAEFGLASMDLLGCYDPAHLTDFAEKADELEAQIEEVLQAQGMAPVRYACVDDFIKDEQTI